MNLKAPISSEKRFLMNDVLVYQKIADDLMERLPASPKTFIIVCIGTDRSTGDALGPLTGSLLNKWKPNHFQVLGTLEKPVHAANLAETITHINQTYRDFFIIAIDACLGKKTSVGTIAVGTGSIQPGAAFNKNLPAIGDVYINGIVNVSGYMDYMVLQSTRLHLVMKMAETLSRALRYVHLAFDYPSEKRMLRKIEQTPSDPF